MRGVARESIAAVACIAALGAIAADRPCGKAEAATAEKAIDKVNTWEQLKRAYDDYRHCDSVQSVADMYTDAILRLTVDWKRVQVFAETMKDPEYRNFVYAHIKSPAAKDDRESVYSRAKTSCPRGLDDFCAGLADVSNPEAGKPVKQELMTPIPAPK